MKPRSYNLLVCWILIAFVAGFFVATHDALSCVAQTPQEHLVGNSCTAERISAATIWSWSEHEAVVPSKELLGFVVAFVLILLTHLFLAIKKPTRGLTFLQRREGPIRSGPAPNGLFLPYLYATHGW